MYILFTYRILFIHHQCLGKQCLLHERQSMKATECRVTSTVLDCYLTYMSYNLVPFRKYVLNHPESQHVRIHTFNLPTGHSTETKS